MYTRLEQHLGQCDILSHSQFGFRKNLSTSHATTLFVERLYNILDCDHFAIGTFLDLKKAFDLVDHDILLKKLSFYGVRGNSLDWFRSYLHGRKQFVVYKDASSSLSDIVCGVPQGSILGPLLFLLHVNDLCEQSNVVQFILFADDTNLLISGTDVNSVVQSLNAELLKLNEWFECNRLCLNVSKTNFIVFSTNSNVTHRHFDVKINGNSLERVMHTKFLGIIIDDKLSWQRHIEHVRNKVSKTIGVLLRVRHKINIKLLRTIYNTLILPHFTYCITLWGNTFKKYIHQLTLLQKRIIRIITFSGFLDHTAPLFSYLKILHFENLYKYHVLVNTYKAINSPVFPNCVREILDFYRNIHTHQTRTINNLKIPFRKKKICTFGLKYNGPRLWNDLHKSIRESSSLSTFKFKLKCHLRKLPSLK